MLGWFKVQKVNNNVQNPRNLSIPSLKKIVESRVQQAIALGEN